MTYERGGIGAADRRLGATDMKFATMYCRLIAARNSIVERGKRKLTVGLENV